MDFMNSRVECRIKHRLAEDVYFVFYRNTPDPVQETQGDGYSTSMMKALSAVYVRSLHYGTRSVFFTHA